MIRKITVLLAGMLVTVAAAAAGAQLRANHPDSYTVRKGDTLWAISAKFLAKPWLWPEIWQANPQVRNPHLIYPGDILNLSFISGGGAGLKLEPSVHAEGTAIPAIPLGQLKPFLKDTRVVDSAVVKALPYVVGLEEAHLDAVTGLNIYVRGLQSSPGQRWAIVRPTHIFRAFDQKNAGKTDMVANSLNSNVSMVRGPWAEDARLDDHVGKGADLGVEVSVIGTAEVLRVGDPSTLLLLDSAQEIRPGDRVMPLDDAPYDPYYYPHPPQAIAKDARVIAFSEGIIGVVGPLQVVALSIGSRDGAENGQTFSIYDVGTTIHDDMASDSSHRDFGKTVTLPEEYVGHVMIFRTFDRVSYGLIMDSLRPVRKGSKLRMPE